MVSGAEGIGVVECAQDVRGATAGGDAHQRVLAGEACGSEVGCALFGGVFGLLAGFAEGGVAAGDKALHESCGDREGWGDLAGIENTEAAAGAGSDIEEAAPVFEAAGDLVDGFGDVREFGGDCLRNLGVLFVDDAEHLQGRELVDVLGERVARFGWELG